MCSFVILLGDIQIAHWVSGMGQLQVGTDSTLIAIASKNNYRYTQTLKQNQLHSDHI